MGHAIEHKHTEVFGLLLGQAVKTPSGRLRTIVQDFIPAEHFTVSTLTAVEVPVGELIRMDQLHEQDVQRRGLLKVGWFHTHPGHGIFMSAVDRENHSLYRKPWHVALVLDPVRQSAGFFAGPTCRKVTDVIGVKLSSPESSAISSSMPPRKNATERLRGDPRAVSLSRLVVLGIVTSALEFLVIMAFEQHITTGALSERLRDAENRADLVQRQLRTVAAELERLRREQDHQSR